MKPGQSANNANWRMGSLAAPHFSAETRGGQACDCLGVGGAATTPDSKGAVLQAIHVQRAWGDAWDAWYSVPETPFTGPVAEHWVIGSWFYIGVQEPNGKG